MHKNCIVVCSQNFVYFLLIIGKNNYLVLCRYEKRYIQVPPTVVHPNSQTLEPRYIREVVASPHHHIDSDSSTATQTLRFGRYAGSSSAESHRYVGSSSGSGLDSPQYNPTIGKSASVIGAPRYEGPAAKRCLNGYVNPAFTLKPQKGTQQGPPVQYVQTLPRKASSVAAAPR